MHWVEGIQEFPPLIIDALNLARRRRSVICKIAGRFPLEQVVDAYRLREGEPDGKVLVLPNA